MTRMLMIPFAVCLLLCGCGGDTVTNPVVEDEIPLAADTIGTAGGAFEASGFQLVIPAGAFDSDAVLTLYESAEEHGFDDNCISQVFRLDGLPESFAESLTVRIEYEGDPGTNLLVAMGQVVTFYDDAYDSSEALAYDFLPATASSGFLEAVVPASHTVASLRNAAVAAAGKREDHFAALKDVEIKSKSEHVTVMYPIDVFGRVQEIVNFIEAAHDTIVSIGMGYQGSFWNWPVVVTIRNLREGSIPVAIPVRYHLSPALGFIIQIHAPFVNEENYPWLRYFLGNLMTTAAQYIPTKNEYDDRDHYPWHCAVAAWMQQYWPPPGYEDRPRYFVGNEIHALEGLPVPHIGILEASYGYGWSAVLGYLVDQYGRDLIGGVYRNTQTSDEKPIADLMQRIPDAAYNWWPRFVDDYVTGKIYGVDTSVLLSAIDDLNKFKIRSSEDTLFHRGDRPHQVSTSPYRIVLDYALIPEGTALQIAGSAFEVDMDWFTLLVYRTKDGVMEQIASGDTVTVGGLRDLTIAGYDLVVYSLLSYNDEPHNEPFLTDIDCRIVRPPTFTDCRIRVGYTGKWQVGDAEPYWEYIEPAWYAEGSFTGNTFTGEIAKWHHGDNTSGSMTVTIDPGTMTVTSFSASAITVEGYGTSTWGVTGNSLPQISYTPGVSLECGVEGTATCSYLTSTQWSYVPAVGDRWDVVGYVCGYDAGIELTFWDYTPSR